MKQRQRQQPKNQRVRRRRNGGINNPVRVKVKIPFTHTLTAAAAQHLVELAFDPDGTASDLDTLSTNLSSYHDMYTYWRLLSAKIEVRNQDGITVPAGGAFLVWAPPNDQAPSAIAEFEGEFATVLDLVSGSNQAANKLNLPVGSLGQQTKWKLCNDAVDATDSNTYGTFSVIGSATFTASDILTCLLEVVVEFRTMNDDRTGLVRKLDYSVTQAEFEAFSPSKKKLFLLKGGKITS